MTLLYDDTQLLLAIDLREDESSLDGVLATLSSTVVTQLALKAKAQAYQTRIDRGLATAANRGASLDELAAAAGMSPDEVIARLSATPLGLVLAGTRLRLGLDRRPAAAPPTPASSETPYVQSAAAEPAAAEPTAAEPTAEPRPRRRGWWRG